MKNRGLLGGGGVEGNKDQRKTVRDRIGIMQRDINLMNIANGS